MSNRKILFFDIDGTLISESSGELSLIHISIGVGTGYASVDGKVVCQGEIMFAIG